MVKGWLSGFLIKRVGCVCIGHERLGHKLTCVYRSWSCISEAEAVQALAVWARDHNAVGAR